jgi:hypothetical protein
VEHGAICLELVGLNRTASATRREQGPVGHQGGEIRVFGFVKAGENVFGGRGLGRARGLPGGHCEIQIAIDSCVSVYCPEGRVGLDVKGRECDQSILDCSSGGLLGTKIRVSAV